MNNFKSIIVSSFNLPRVLSIFTLFSKDKFSFVDKLRIFLRHWRQFTLKLAICKQKLENCWPHLDNFSTNRYLPEKNAVAFFNFNLHTSQGKFHEFTTIIVKLAISFFGVWTCNNHILLFRKLKHFIFQIGMDSLVEVGRYRKVLI